MNRHDGSPSSVFSDICTPLYHLCTGHRQPHFKAQKTLYQGHMQEGSGDEETEELQEDKELTLLFLCACSQQGKKKKYVKFILKSWGFSC